MSVAVKTIPNSRATVAIGSCNGRETDQNFLKPVAPSIAAESSISFGIEARPARKITVANGMIRQAWTAITEPIASLGCASHCGGDTVLARCRCCSVQLMIEYVVSKIHVQPMRLSGSGAAHGRRIRKRRSHLPGNFLSRA